jgi:serine/threonine protein kinase
VPDVTDLRPGDPERIAGYRVLSRLGSGGQGVVFLAAAASGDLVAIKLLLHGPEDTQARLQFAKEVAAARLVAPFCTAQVVDAQLDVDAPYVVSEFIAGPSLQQHIQRNGPLHGTTLQRMAIGTVTALAAIHQAGVVHRDFKPANVMISPEGPRVIDFGIARDLSTETTVTSRVFGTPAYMSPEQLRADIVGPATDMFAWASVITYAATGRAPFDAPHIMAVMYRISSGEPDLSGVPADLIDVLRHCLAKDPTQRPTAQQALAQLLGRPAVQRDQTDPSMVLAEATGLVRPVDSGPVGAAGTGERPPFEQQPFQQPPFAQQPSSGSTADQPVWGSPPPEPAGLVGPTEPTRPVQPVDVGQPAWGTAVHQPPPGTHPHQPPPGAHPHQPPPGAHPQQPAWGTDVNQRPAWGADLRQAGPRRRRRPLVRAAVVLALILGGAAAVDAGFSWQGSGDDAASREPDYFDENWTPEERSAFEAAAEAQADSEAEREATSADDLAADAIASAAPGLGDLTELSELLKSGDQGTVVVGGSGSIPAAFAGTWKGRISEIGTTDSSPTVRLTIKAGAPSGRLKFIDRGCSGTVKLTTAVAALMTMDAVITQDPKKRCSKRGKVVVSLQEKDLKFVFVDGDAGRVGTGTLKR